MPTDSGGLRALLFDFDGLVVDTESVILRAWEGEYARHGVEFPAEHFVRANVGTIRGQPGYLDEYDELERLVGAPVDRREITRRRVEAHDRWLADAEPNPGVRDWLDAARAAGLRLAVASSSPREWVVPLLERLGLAERFEHVSTRTDVDGRAKPDPAVYLHALEGLGVGAPAAVALEDSPAGVRAAKRAGIAAVAVPSEITRSLDFSEADVVVDSLAELTLEELLAWVPGS